ncbi:MAG TPA: hypothetical protein PKW55_04120 [Spirochaetota bacterium]|nr:hypothetical protein [Spirochaetota bacterium]HOM37977.1 hypothetical protein [Spirochaetota bacterium]HPQ48782.1 hypothetical protein [Spirochaetota bacterium]
MENKTFYPTIFKIIILFLFIDFFGVILGAKNYFSKFNYVLGDGSFRYEGTTHDKRYLIKLYEYAVYIFFIHGEKKIYLSMFKTDIRIDDIFYNNHNIFVNVDNRIIKYDIKSDSFKEEDDSNKKKLILINNIREANEYYRMAVTNKGIKIGNNVVFLYEEPLSYVYFIDKKIEISDNNILSEELERTKSEILKKLFSDLKIEELVYDKRYIKTENGFIVFYPDIDIFFKYYNDFKYMTYDENSLDFLVSLYPEDLVFIKSFIRIKVQNKKREELEKFLKKYNEKLVKDNEINTILADFYYSEGDYNRAKGYIKNVKTAYSYFILGNINFIENNLREAEINYKKSISLDKNFYKAYNNLASLYINQKKYLLAETLLIDGIKNNINSPSLYYNLGIVYEKINKIPLSYVLYEKAYSLIKMGEDAVNKKEIINSLYFTYIKLNNLDKAEELIKDVINQDPAEPTSYYNLGYVYELKKDIKKAIFYYNLFLEVNKNQVSSDLVKRVELNIKKLLKDFNK